MSPHEFMQIIESGSGTYIPFFLLSLIFTLIAYGIFPLIFAKKIRKKVITEKQYKILCYCVNFFVLILLAAINGRLDKLGIHSGPYFLWTWVFSAYGIKTLKQKGLLADSQPSIDTKTTVSQPTKESNAKAPTLQAIKEAHAKLLPASSNKEPCSESPKKPDTIPEVSPVLEKSPVIYFCWKCGFKLIKDSNFCSQCGHRIASGNETAN